MKIKLTEDEAVALILMRRMFRRAATPVPHFLSWVADRLVYINRDDPNVDFVQALRERSQQLGEIAQLLGTERVP